MKREWSWIHRQLIKYLPEFDVNVFEAVVNHSKIFNLTIYREILIKKIHSSFRMQEYRFEFDTC